MSFAARRASVSVGLSPFRPPCFPAQASSFSPELGGARKERRRCRISATSLRRASESRVASTRQSSLAVCKFGRGDLSAVAASLNHFVRAQQKRLRHGDAERLCRLGIDDQLEARWLLDRKVAGIGALLDLLHVR